MSDLAAAQSELQTIFGFAAFRPGQAEIVSAILDGRDVLAVMPTGSGKSLCYQLPALVRDGLTVVVSPLIALMRDQVAQLCANGIAAASLNSANDPAENRAILERIGRGELRLVYVAPERLLKSDTLDLLKRANVTLLAVDEAHCISQWGHDFRPEYAALGTVQSNWAACRRRRSRRPPTPQPVPIFWTSCSHAHQLCSCTASTAPTCAWPCAPRPAVRTQIADFSTAATARAASSIARRAARPKSWPRSCARAASNALPYHAGIETPCARATRTPSCRRTAS